MNLIFRLNMEKIIKLTIITLFFMVNINFIKSGKYPSGLHVNETTSCEEFSRYARFNPYSVLSDEWMVFYYWGALKIPMFAKFRAPRKIDLDYLKYILDGHVLEPINFTARSVLYTGRNNATYFFVEKNDRGHYLVYKPEKGLPQGHTVNAVEVRLKQTGDNRYFGIMFCADETVYLYARVKDVPKRKHIQDEAARLGYKGRGGRSYLYQGHHWMPIPEADDEDFEEVLNRNEI